MNLNVDRVVLIFLFLSLFSCSSDEEEVPVFESSLITNFEWELSSFNVENPIDLNLDGVLSIDMVEEFECLKDESYNFESISKSATYFISPLQVNFLNNDTSLVSSFECRQGITIPSFGSFEMINETTISITVDLAVLPPKTITKILAYDNDRLIQEINSEYYTYDKENEVFVRGGNLLISKVFTKR